MYVFSALGFLLLFFPSLLVVLIVTRGMESDQAPGVGIITCVICLFEKNLPARRAPQLMFARLILRSHSVIT